MLLGLLLTLNILVCLALIGVVLLQRSEGGALGGGGSPTGLVTTRGAGDLLTRTTWVLFTLFLLLSLALTLLGGRERSSQAIIDRLKLQSVNPEALATHPPPSAPAGEASSGAVPASTSGALPSAPKPTIRPPGAAPAVPAAPGGSSAFSAPTPTVSLPPLPTPVPAPAKTPPP